MKSENINCGFTRCPTYLLPAKAEPVPGDSRDPRSSTAGASERQSGECMYSHTTTVLSHVPPVPACRAVHSPDHQLNVAGWSPAGVGRYTDGNQHNPAWGRMLQVTVDVTPCSTCCSQFTHLRIRKFEFLCKLLEQLRNQGTNHDSWAHTLGMLKAE